MTEPEPVPRAGPVGQAVAAAVPVAAGAGCLAYTMTLPLGTPIDPGPGLWPAVASVLLVGAGSWVLVMERDGEGVEQFGPGTRGVALGVLMLVGYVLLVRRIGFEIPTLLLIAGWLRLLGGEPWRVTAAVSVGATAVLYVVFVLLLGVPLPRLTF